MNLIFEGKRVRITNVHLGLKYWERAFQIDRILAEVVWKDEECAILVGDLNEWLAYSPNSLRLSRSFRPSASVSTFPSQWPRLALDRIFLSGSVREYSIGVPKLLEREASDHLPIMVDLELS